MSIQQWLDSEPLPEEIKERNGGKYIPIHIIIQKLNYLCGELSGYSGNWSTPNFQHLYHNFSHYIKEKGKTAHKTVVSGSIELHIEYHEPNLTNSITNTVESYKTVKRVLSGSASFLINGTQNPHTTSTVRSLATVSAAQLLGRQFGYGLNGFETTEDEFPEEQSMDEADEESPNREAILKGIETAQDLIVLDIYKKLSREDKVLSNAFRIKLIELQA